MTRQDPPAADETDSPLTPPDGTAAKPHRISIIGLGRLGRALAAALRAQGGSYRVVGHDREPERSRAALAAGAVDRVAWTLPGAVEEADLLILCEGLDHSLESLELAAPHLKEGALVIDCAPLKVPMLARAAALLPAGRGFVGSHPLLGGLPDPDAAPAADPSAPFRGRSWCLCVPTGAPPLTLGTAERLVRSLGARPIYIDAAEHDALVGGAQLLPLLAELAFLGPLSQSPSAADLRRLGAPALLARLGDAAELGDTLTPLAAAQPETLLRWLDAQLGALARLREALAAGPAAYEAWLAAALEPLAAWERPEERPGGIDRALETMGPRRDLTERLFGRWGRGREQGMEGKGG